MLPEGKLFHRLKSWEYGGGKTDDDFLLPILSTNPIKEDN
jgi:hypothetical protein